MERDWKRGKKKQCVAKWANSPIVKRSAQPSSVHTAAVVPSLIHTPVRESSQTEPFFDEIRIHRIDMSPLEG
jgi:hypothetical protein